ncbi:MAG: polysaccharide deacetylase family protein [Acidobacteria bacterium]|nr:polysaccharide deacetylase family protein [Acidobacteriota bacterium]
MFLELLGGAGLAAAGITAYGVRGKSSQLFGPSVWRGPSHRKAIALTFDDGPSESTLDLLSLLYDYQARATFFQCGHHVRRLPRVTQRCALNGHQIGNHTDTHQTLYLRSPDFIFEQLDRAQRIITETTGVTPALFRPTYGARWYGLRAAQKRLNLLGVMWTVIARDWRLSAAQVASYVAPRVRPGAILCFHDGRELIHHPDISSTIGALKLLLPQWLDQGYELLTVSELLGDKRPART